MPDARLIKFADTLFLILVGYVIGFISFAPMDVGQRAAIAFVAVIANALVHTLLLNLAGAFRETPHA